MFSSQNSQVSNDANYIEDVFSTYLYTGNGSAQGISNGINLGATYGGSGYFGGASATSGLTAPASTSWQLTGDYTVEAWIYVVTLANGTIYATGGSGAADQFTYTAAGELYFANQGTGTGVITAGSWIHVAAARSGTTQKIFVNGVAQSTTTVSGTIGQNATAYIGRRVDTTNYVTGYISNLRVVNGTAVYTSNFTPSTVPLTAITNTVLLTCQANGFVDASTNAFTITNTNAIATTNYGPFTSTTAGKGGMVWGKNRDGNWSHYLADTAQGTGKFLESNTTSATQLDSTSLTAFNANGFSIGNAGAFINNNGVNYASWTFRKQPKFFDVVTYTGNGASYQDVAHSLGSTPGCIMVKCTSTGSTNWMVAHRASALVNANLILNSTASAATIASETIAYSSVDGSFNGYFRVLNDLGTADPNNYLNVNGRTYVAYLFAHNAGGFGLTGTDNVISCGSYTGTGATGNTITLGYEPQWVLIKDTTTAYKWMLIDNMRGFSMGTSSAVLSPNSSDAETANGAIQPTATGFTLTSGGGFLNGSGDNYIYIAIRRGPMKVPTSGTSVLNITTSAGTSPAYVSSFPVDFAYRKQITSTSSNYFHTRLQGAKTLYTNSTAAEDDDSNVTWAYQNGMFTTTGANADQYGWLMRRAPSFFDVVCWRGNSASSNNQTHNLTVVPELVIYKNRTSSQGWYALAKQNSTNSFLWYQNAFTTSAATTGWVTSDFCTSTTIQVGDVAWGGLNDAFTDYVAYLFASCSGVSKVGTYTGNGSTQTIDCGFTGGARFVLIKRTDSTGDWYVYDTARGMTVLTDPYLRLNSTGAEVATLGSVTTVSTGFALNATILAAINTNAASYIFLAIA